jgi:hypothetical protein
VVLSLIDELRSRIKPSDELYKRGQILEAIESLRPVVAERPDYFRPYYNFGFFHFLIQDYRRAAEYARIATEKMPNFADGWLILGKSLGQLAQFEEAETALRQALKLHPDNVGASIWLGWTLGQSHRYQEAAAATRCAASRLGWTTPEQCSLTFSQEPWFLNHIGDWVRLLEPNMHKVEHGLEIGCMEGMSTIWTAEHLLSPMGRLLVNDIIFRENFLTNIGKAGIKGSLDLRQGPSEEVLPTLQLNDFDFAYVDGDHTRDSVFRDAVNALVLVKPGSIIILDDYGKQNEKTAIGLDLFLRLFERNVEVIDKRYQLVLRRLNEPVIVQNRLGPVWRDALSGASAARLDELVRHQPAKAVSWLRSGKAKLR